MPNWVKILFALLPKKAIAELVLSGLKKLADKTDTKIDDEAVENIELWLRENGILDEIQIAKIKDGSKSKATSQEKK